MYLIFKTKNGVPKFLHAMETNEEAIAIAAELERDAESKETGEIIYITPATYCYQLTRKG